MPTEEKFTYLSHIAHGIRAFDLSLFHSVDELWNVTVSNAIYSSRSKLAPDARLIEILLRNSWQTESAARWPLDFGDSDVQRVMAHTLGMHVYYSLFNAARANASVEGMKNPTHEAIHKDFRSNRIQRATGAWSYWSTGDTGMRDSISLMPTSTTIPKFSGLSWNLGPGDYLALSMLTARNWHIEYKKNEYKKNSKVKQLRGQQRLDFFSRNNESTLLDLVYQLRRRANYEEIDEYGSEVGDDVVERFYNGLIHICFSGLMLYESMIASRIGHSQYSAIVDRWLTNSRLTGSGGPVPVSERWGYISAYVQ